MDWIGFAILLNDNIGLYIGILIISTLFYILIFKRFFISILDPVLLAVLFSVFGFSVVWFLYFTGNIEVRYLVSYLLTQVAFWGGLFTFKSLTKKQITSPYRQINLQDQQLFEKLFFLISSGIYVIVQLLSYKAIGIPLLIGTHIDVYNNSGGWGILGRIIYIVQPCSVFMLIYFLLKKGTSFLLSTYKYLFLCLVVIFFALSGSKSEFLSLGFIIFCFLILNANKYLKKFRKINRWGVLLLAAGVCFAFIAILFTPGSIPEGQTSADVFLFRFIASGDTYFFAYPNHNIEHINNSQPFLALFGDIFSTLRIIPRDKQPVVLGVQFFRMFSDLEITAGPNARHNVFGYAYFGFYGSIVFSYLIGLTLSLVRNKLFFMLRKNIIGQIVFVLLYINLAGIETDPPMAILSIENVALMLPPLLLLTTLLLASFINNKTSPNLNIS